MSVNRLKLTFGLVVIAVMTLILLWSNYRAGQAEIQQMLDHADRDAAAAKAAAVDAAGSAAKAADAARDARNKLPGLF